MRVRSPVCFAPGQAGVELQSCDGRGAPLGETLEEKMRLSCTRPSRRALGAVAAQCVLLFLAAGCNLDSYRLSHDNNGGSDAAVRDGGADAGGDGGGGMSDARPPDGGCVPTSEVCGDNVDNDCDGMIDEGFDLMQDPANCGACGNTCASSHAAGTCDQGVCSYACLPGFYDLDGDLGVSAGNGCEYGPCFVANGGVEECNFSDDDCDGLIDEGVDTDTDIMNCGSCANVCHALNAEPLCVSGTCTFGACAPGYADVLASVPGCEYACPQYPPAAQESCDGIDNDCDGTIDELPIAGLGDACTAPGYEMYGDTGECAYGITACNFGVPTCVGYQGPTSEICDDLDNDCDGVTDEGFDKLSDARHCGGCNNVCNLPNAINGCTAGVCTIVACRPGWQSPDGIDSNGCEYACTPSGPETCDGRDNDCDTRVDEDLIPPGNFCATQGACAGTTPSCAECEGVTQWRCVYGGAAEVGACGTLAIQESLCDGIDGDCDGRIDEHQPLKATNCDDGGIGVCRGTGEYICVPADPLAPVVCDITDPGQPPLGFELCNNVDDDCDGIVDELAFDDMVMVTGGTLPPFWIDVYEASRPDATAAYGGRTEHRACSVPGTIPWRNVSHAEAEAACVAAGKRLCTEPEWQLACEGMAGNRYPYGPTYDGFACNGKDYDPDCTAPDDNDIVQPTGTAYGCPTPPGSMCVSDYGAYDMSGNLKEWTGTEVPAGSGSYRVRGGSYDNIAQGLTCQFDFISFGSGTIFPNLGFRCCSDSAP
jgi:hypothetical protein